MLSSKLVVTNGFEDHLISSSIGVTVGFEDRYLYSSLVVGFFMIDVSTRVRFLVFKIDISIRVWLLTLHVMI